MRVHAHGAVVIRLSDGVMVGGTWGGKRDAGHVRGSALVLTDDTHLMITSFLLHKWAKTECQGFVNRFQRTCTSPST